MIKFPLPQIPPRSSPLSYPPNSIFSLPQNIKTNRRPIRQKMAKQSKKLSLSQKSWHLPHVGQLCLGMGPVLECSWYTQWYTPLEKADFPFSSSYQLQAASLLGVEAHVDFPISELGPCLTWNCVSPMLVVTSSVCELTCASVWLYLKDIASLELSITSGSYHFCASSSM